MGHGDGRGADLLHLSPEATSVRPDKTPSRRAGAFGSGGGDIEDRVVREISASFLACREQYPHVQAKEIILMTADSSQHWESMLSRELGVSVECLTWNHIDVLGWKACSGGTSLAALPVVAGMI